MDRESTVIIPPDYYHRTANHPISRPNGSGASCFYYAMESRPMGLKAYYNIQEREDSYLRQLYAHKHGLAPAVGSRCLVVCPNHPWQDVIISAGNHPHPDADADYVLRNYGYRARPGFWTERAAPCSLPAYNGSSDEYRHRERVRERIDREMETLERELRKLRLGGDLAYCNCGYLGSKLVCIDFGDHSGSRPSPEDLERII